jgi:hypothetical protein
VLLVDEEQKRVLIVESKHEALQGAPQLQREIQAVQAAYRGFATSLVAAGGDNVYREVEATKTVDAHGIPVQVSAMSWRRLADAVRQQVGRAPSGAEGRCLRALLDGLEWFGYRRFGGLHFPLPGGWPLRELIFPASLVAPAVRNARTLRWFNDVEPLCTGLPTVSAIGLARWRIARG